MDEEAQLGFLPDDVIYQTLLRLPSKSLIRFRTLSNQWNHIITSDRFLSEFRNGSIVVRLRASTFSPNLHNYPPYALVHRWCPIRSQLDPHHGALSVVLPTPSIKYDRYWLSSSGVDGLLCVIYKRVGATDIALWNPCTGMYRMVTWPGGIWEDLDDSIMFVGYCYDASISDYKVVVVYLSHVNYDQLRKRIGCGVGVTTLKSGGVWRRLAVDVPSLFVRPIGMPLGVEVRFEAAAIESGDLYWLCQRNSGAALLSFSLREEKVKVTIPSPLEEVNLWNFRKAKGAVQLSVYNGYFYIWYLRSGCLLYMWKRHARDPCNGKKWKEKEMWKKSCCEFVGFTSEGVLILRDYYNLFASNPRVDGKPFYIKPIKRDLYSDSVHFLEAGSSVSP